MQVTPEQEQEQEQKQKMARLSELLESDDFSIEDRQFLSSGKAALRYLVAHKWNVDVAHGKIRETIQWRKEYGPHLIAKEDILDEIKQGYIYHSGFCKEGRPVVVVRKRVQMVDAGIQNKVLIHTMEEAISRMQGDVYQMVMIFDMANLSRENSPPLSVTMGLLGLLGAHYPERLFKVFFVYQPWLFTLLYNIVHPFLDNRQRSKVHVAGSDFAAIRDKIDPDQLEVRYGGTAIRDNIDQEQVEVAAVKGGEYNVKVCEETLVEMV